MREVHPEMAHVGVTQPGTTQVRETLWGDWNSVGIDSLLNNFDPSLRQPVLHLQPFINRATLLLIEVGDVFNFALLDMLF